MGLITRAMAKKLAANNPGSGALKTVTAVPRRSVSDEKDSAVNVDSERDVNGNCVPPNGRDIETNEVLKSKIYKESESIATCSPPSTDPKSGTNNRRRRGTKATCTTKPRRVTQATKRKGGSSRETLTPDVSGKILPDHGPPKVGGHDAKVKRGTSETTSKVATGRKRGREEISDADLQTGDVVSKRAKTRRIHRSIRRSTPVGEAPSVARNLRDSTNANPGVDEANDVLSLPATQHGAEQRHDEMPNLNSVSDSAAVCSGQSQKENVNAPAARLTSSPLPSSRRKGTCSATEFVLARTMLAMSKSRNSSALRNDTEPSGDRNEAGFPHRNPSESFPSTGRRDGATAQHLPGDHAEAVESEATPTWEARELDPDDFAFLLRRAMPYRFEESNMRNEAFARPTLEE
ncbi:hypothetical protein ACEPAG_2655 [Sanghuangporus baumii]